MTVAFLSAPSSLVPKVGIVLLNWNSWQDTAECLESLKTLAYPNFQIVVVDNASTNNSVKELKSRFPNVELIENTENIGFAAGNNLGIRYFISKEVDYVWVLNNDTTVSLLSLNTLVEKAESNKKIGVVGSVVYEYNEPWLIQAWGGGKYNSFLATTINVDTKDGKVGYITGASMLIRRKTLEKAGLFDESLFFFMEDVEYSLRIKSKKWKIAVADLSYVFHKGGSSLDGNVGARSVRADLLFINSVGRFMRIRKMRMISVILRLIIIVFRRIQQGQFIRIPSLIKTYLKGYQG